mmetsp:Transcript_6138/g.18546  ORF Transcript_6138/g.18546 Transcript_6138/m.18546 type:complete len:101 (+) Transcript_6138:1386-1688(+)
MYVGRRMDLILVTTLWQLHEAPRRLQFKDSRIVVGVEDRDDRTEHHCEQCAGIHGERRPQLQAFTPVINPKAEPYCVYTTENISFKTGSSCNYKRLTELL